MSEEVVTLEARGVGIDDRIASLLIAAYEVRHIVADKLTSTACEHHEKVAPVDLQRWLDKVVESLDTAKHDIVLRCVGTWHVTATSSYTALKGILES